MDEKIMVRELFYLGDYAINESAYELDERGVRRLHATKENVRHNPNPHVRLVIQQFELFEEETVYPSNPDLP